MSKIIKAAAVQADPVLFDTPKTMVKLAGLLFLSAGTLGLHQCNPAISGKNKIRRPAVMATTNARTALPLILKMIGPGVAILHHEKIGGL
jgi:hypothetical protein